MGRQWTPQRPEWRCVCGHVVEDHGDQSPLWPGKPLWPCLACGCDDFVEDLTDYLWTEGGS